MWVAIQLQVDSLLHEQMTIRAEWFRSRKLLVAGCRGGKMAGRGSQGAPTPPWLCEGENTQRGTRCQTSPGVAPLGNAAIRSEFDNDY
jgi:hypothetical protein